MSGTSADGVDAALVRITGCGTQTRVRQLGFRFVPFSDAVRAEILRLAGGGAATAADFCRMNFLLGELFCEAGEALCAQTGTKLSDIDLIGSHGQTFWHIPEKEEYLSRAFTSTFQLGEEAVLAERRRRWRPRPRKYQTGTLRLFSEHAASPMKGAYLEFPD